MKAYIAGAFFTIALVLCLQTGGAIKCYSCNSFYDPGCADWFDNQTYPLVQCTQNATMCRKTVQESFAHDKWTVRVIRQCAWEGKVGGDDGRRCVEEKGIYRVKIKNCQCDAQDGCNGSAKIAFTVTTPIATIFLIFGLIAKVL